MDEEMHGRLRRPVANAFSMTTLVEYEPLVDKTFRNFTREIDRRFIQTDTECKLADWLQMYAFDIIGEITFSTDLGFLKSGRDVDNMMYYTNQVMEYSGVMGQLPTLDEIFRVKNILLHALKPTGNVVSWTLKQIRAHVEKPEIEHPDILTRLVAARQKDPEVVTEDRMVDYANTIVSAGSDTTAIALREIVYQILIHPTAYERLMQEIGTVLHARTAVDDKPITWAEGSNMKYLQACIQESLRHHPAIAQILPRVVPEGGLELYGHYLPTGTITGCNAYTVHKDQSVFGPDADIWRPERWLDSDIEYVKRMQSLLFTFGAGPRVCIGKNIALLEVTKFIPEFFRRFQVKLVDKERYKSRPGWLSPQRGLDVFLAWREAEA